MYLSRFDVVVEIRPSKLTSPHQSLSEWVVCVSYLPNESTSIFHLSICLDQSVLRVTFCAVSFFTEKLRPHMTLRARAKDPNKSLAATAESSFHYYCVYYFFRFHSTVPLVFPWNKTIIRLQVYNNTCFSSCFFITTHASGILPPDQSRNPALASPKKRYN